MSALVVFKLKINLLSFLFSLKHEILTTYFSVSQIPLKTELVQMYFLCNYYSALTKRIRLAQERNLDYDSWCLVDLYNTRAASTALSCRRTTSSETRVYTQYRVADSPLT